MNDKTCVIPTYDVLSDKEIQFLNQHSYEVNFKQGENIFRQNTPVSHFMFLKSGLVKIFKEGRNQRLFILKIQKKCHFLGMLSLFGHPVYQYSATAIEDAQVTFIDKNVFLEVIQGNGKYANFLLNQIALNGLQIFDKLINITNKQLPGRIAELILHFAEDIYESEEFEFPLTRQELAELTSTTKESLIRTLSEFKHDKIIEISGKSIHIKSMRIIRILSEMG